MPLHTHQESYNIKKKKKRRSAGVSGEVEKLEPLYIAGGNIKSWSCYGKQFGGS